MRGGWYTAGVAGVLVAASACGGSARPHAPPAPAPRIDGWLRTSHGQIIGADGRPVRLLGVDEPGLISGAGNDRAAHPDACKQGWRPPNPSEYAEVRRWGFNSVRLGLSWANLEPTPPRTDAAGNVVHRWNRPYLAALDRAVAGFTNAGVAVVLDMHQNHMSAAFAHPAPDRCEGSGFPVWLYPHASVGPAQAQCDFFAGRTQSGVPIDIQSGYTKAWIEVAHRYAANRLVVAADLFNEPSVGKCPGLDVTSFYRALGTRIRRADPHLLLICEDGTGRNGLYALRRPVGVPGWVYSFHLYLRAGDSVSAVIGARLARASTWQVPVWVGELGLYQRGQATLPANAERQLRTTVVYLRRHQAGWAFHQYAGGGAALIRRIDGTVHSGWVAALQSGF
jgi:hypothetical protein